MIIYLLLLQEEIAKLLRFESSKLSNGQRTSLSDYSSRQKDDQKSIFYLAAPRYVLLETQYKLLEL